jgi:hypothetical protein
MKNPTAYLPMTRGQHILGMEGKEVHPVMRSGGKNALGQEIKTLLMMLIPTRLCQEIHKMLTPLHSTGTLTVGVVESLLF